MMAHEEFNEAMMAASGEELRPLLRARIRARVTHEAKHKHPDWSIEECRAAARQLTDEQIIDAAKQAANQANFRSIDVDAVQDWWAWIKANWLTIAGILVSILILFI